MWHLTLTDDEVAAVAGCLRLGLSIYETEVQTRGLGGLERPNELVSAGYAVLEKLERLGGGEDVPA